VTTVQIEQALREQLEAIHRLDGDAALAVLIVSRSG